VFYYRVGVKDLVKYDNIFLSLLSWICSFSPKLILK